MGSGYSGTPLVKKLGIRKSDRVCLLDEPENYRDLLGPLPDGVTFHALSEEDLDFVHLFAVERGRADEFISRARTSIVPDGMIWVSWPKKASGVRSELDGNVVRGLGLGHGLVDVKVCAVDETWSGLKFVIRRADRPQTP